MAVITASMVGELRAKTDAPMMECKKALTEADGNMDKAEELLRIKLGNKAGKASGRITAEGVVTASVDGNTGGMIEINCETDFVTKNDSFLAFAKAAAVLVPPRHCAATLRLRWVRRWLYSKRRSSSLQRRVTWLSEPMDQCPCRAP